MPNRTDVYGNANFDEVSVEVNLFSSTILENVGVYSVEPSMPILYQMARMSYFGMFIGVILKLIVFSLFCLSVLMMYNMMMIGVETRNFDFGMLRTVGMNKKSLMLTVLVDSLKYVLVANLVAFPVSFWTLKLTSGIFTKFFGFDYVLTPTFDAIAIASVIGFLVPLVASFVPIRVALGEKIIEAINPIRNKTIAIKH
jgi:ABC-type antimicrobial peptide transport system permease subunit